MWRKVEKRVGLPPDGTRAMGTNEMFTGFVLLGAGLVLALAVSGCEIVLESKKHERPVDVEAVLKVRFGKWEK